MNECENNLNRSHSESDLHNVVQGSVNRLCSRDIYKSSPTIIRRTFCVEEIIFPAGTMKPHFSPSGSRKQISEKRKYQNISFNDSRNGLYSPEGYLESDDVPMDIDTSLNYDERYPKIMGSGHGTPFKIEEIGTSEKTRYKSFDNNLKQRLAALNSNKVDVQNPDVSTIKCRNLADPQKVTHIKNVQEKKSNIRAIILFLAAVVAVFFGCSPYLFRDAIDNDVQIQNIHHDLIKNVYEQKHVVKTVVRSLEQRENWSDKKKLLAFVGSQGVGKTYVTNIIKQNFAQDLAHEIYGPYLQYKTERDKIMEAMNDCCLNLIVIDDLRQKDDVELFAFMHALPSDHHVLVITIFNIHYKTNKLETVLNKEDILEIGKSLDQSGLNQELVVFHDFTTEQIEDWVKKQLGNHNVSTANQESLMRAVLDAHNVKHGLKGLHSKITLELEKNYY